MSDVTMSDVTLGKVAYEAYSAAAGGKSLVSGVPLPEWYQVDPIIRDAWNKTADAVLLESAARHAQNYVD